MAYLFDVTDSEREQIQNWFSQSSDWFVWALAGVEWYYRFNFSFMCFIFFPEILTWFIEKPDYYTITNPRIPKNESLILSYKFVRNL